MNIEIMSTGSLRRLVVAYGEACRWSGGGTEACEAGGRGGSSRLSCLVKVLFIWLIIRLIQLVFSTETVFFSYKKLAVFQPAYHFNRTAPKSVHSSPVQLHAMRFCGGGQRGVAPVTAFPGRLPAAFFSLT
jgi:hypothetical protein